MIEGQYIEKLGMYLVIELTGGKIKRISLSRHPPDCPSELADALVRQLYGRDPPALDYEVQFDLSGLTSFQRHVYAIVQEIPRGETRTYGQVAQALGMPSAARAVGGALRKNPFALAVPCHRVVSAMGIGGFSYGVEHKKRLLEIEQSTRQPVKKNHSSSSFSIKI